MLALFHARSSVRQCWFSFVFFSPSNLPVTSLPLKNSWNSIGADGDSRETRPWLYHPQPAINQERTNVNSQGYAPLLMCHSHEMCHPVPPPHWHATPTPGVVHGNGGSEVYTLAFGAKSIVFLLFFSSYLSLLLVCPSCFSLSFFSLCVFFLSLGFLSWSQILLFSSQCFSSSACWTKQRCKLGFCVCVVQMVLLYWRVAFQGLLCQSWFWQQKTQPFHVKCWLMHDGNWSGSKTIKQKELIKVVQHCVETSISWHRHLRSGKNSLNSNWIPDILACGFHLPCWEWLLMLFWWKSKTDFFGLAEGPAPRGEKMVRSFDASEKFWKQRFSTVYNSQCRSTWWKTTDLNWHKIHFKFSLNEGLWGRFLSKLWKIKPSLCIPCVSEYALKCFLLTGDGIAGLSGPHIRAPPRFHTKSGWPRPKAQPAPWQISWIFMSFCVF